MSFVSWIVKQGLCKPLGPVLGPMACFGITGVTLIDKQFAKNDRAALETARGRNGDCPHILLAFSSNTFSEGSVAEANAGDRQKTEQIGKRFTYPDTTYLFWHPSASFLPDGNVSAVYMGTQEFKPKASGQPTLSAAPPVKGAATCPFCSKRTLDAVKEVERYTQWSKGK